MRRRARWAHAVRVALVSLVLLVGALAVLLSAGCSDEPATTTTAAVAPTTTAATTPVADAPRLTQLVAEEETPLEVAQALTTQTALVILVYVPGGTDDELVKASLDALAPRYKDVSFVSYDFSRPESLGDLSTQLGSHYPPFAAFVDAQGIVQYFTTGYADEAVFNQYVVNIRQLSGSRTGSTNQS